MADICSPLSSLRPDTTVSVVQVVEDAKELSTPRIAGPKDADPTTTTTTPPNNPVKEPQTQDEEERLQIGPNAEPIAPQEEQQQGEDHQQQLGSAGGLAQEMTNDKEEGQDQEQKHVQEDSANLVSTPNEEAQAPPENAEPAPLPDSTVPLLVEEAEEEEEQHKSLPHDDTEEMTLEYQDSAVLNEGGPVDPISLLSVPDELLEESPSLMVGDHPPTSCTPLEITDPDGLVGGGVLQEQPGLMIPAKQYNLWERISVNIARYPRLHFWIALCLSATLGIIGMTTSNLNSADHTGWHARGTIVANRHSQLLMVRRHAQDLLYDTDGSVWKDLIANVQPGWEDVDSSVTGGEKDYRRRQLQLARMDEDPTKDALPAPQEEGNDAVWRKLLTRRLQEETMSLSSKLAECDMDWYSDGRMHNGTRLWPVWKAKRPDTSLLNPALLQELCVSETNTQRFLEERNLCTGCPSPDQCLPPYSLVLFARLNVKGGMDMTCQELATAWETNQEETEHLAAFRQCTTDLKETTKTLEQLEEEGLPDSCPFGFDPSLVDLMVDETSIVYHTSSLFATATDRVHDLYDVVDEFDRGTDHIQGAYDTQYQDFSVILAEEAVGTDMILATASAIITTLAMLIHTRSPFLTGAGLLQICLSFPLAFFVYMYVFGLKFFPFLNFIGVFIVFALGADDVFVAVDKWRNVRTQRPTATTEQVAAAALPDAAYAMLLTTSTTSVAFFGTAICPVAPIRVFAIFCGLLIFLDYIMVLVILFPGLCLYDEYQRLPPPQRFHWLIRFEWCHSSSQQGTSRVPHKLTFKHRCGTMEQSKSEEDSDAKSSILEVGKGEEEEQGSRTSDPDKDSQGKGEMLGVGQVSYTSDPQGISSDERGTNTPHQYGNSSSSSSSSSNVPLDPMTAAFAEETAEHPSLIRRILLAYYRFIHWMGWPLLAASLVALGVCVYVAFQIELPESSEVRILKPNVQYEQSYAWRMKLLSTELVKKEGSKAYVIWGVTPADTGDHQNPRSWTQLVLDDTFDPSSQEAQVYMRDFCSQFFNNPDELAKEPEPDYTCPINRFEEWLERQSNLTERNTIWTSSCSGASSLPMDAEAFHPCISAWAQMEEEPSILTYNGRVQVMFFPFTGRARFDSTNDELKAEWERTEDWMSNAMAQAPAPVSNAFFSAATFWYYDTTTQMYNTAYGSIAIALAASAIVILISSKSLIMTLFSVVSVAYVLASVISMTLAVGWTLGFLESICFAIVIGISVDFVIHFSHAYTTPVGKVCREERTKFALISMGPSILAAAFTTIAGASIMFFTTLEFFSMFAMVLFFTIIQATVGSFVFFLALAVCIGPSQPTYFADIISAKCASARTTNPVTPEAVIESKASEDSADSKERAKEIAAESLEDISEEVWV